MGDLKDRLKRFPQWLQKDVERLERQVDYYRDRLTRTEVGDTDVWIRDYIDGDEALPPGSMIRFLLDGGGRLDVLLANDGRSLEVRDASGKAGSLAVLPVVSNVVRLTVLEEPA